MEKLTTLQEGAVEIIVPIKETAPQIMITDQEKYAIKAFHDMFGEGLTDLYSETASAIRISGISKETEPYMNVNLPNVTVVGKYIFRGDQINKIYMPHLQTTNTYAFNTADFYRGAFFPSLTETKSNDFGACGVYGPIYLPNITTLYPATFARSDFKSYLILKNPPTLSSAPAAANWSTLKIFIPKGKTANFEAATNWATAISRIKEFREATTYETDYEDIWKMLVEDGHLTEEEIRRDFYAES